MLIIKKIIAGIAFVFIFINGRYFACAEEAPSVSALSAVLVNKYGDILFEKDSERQMLIASTTKLMTALIVLENADIDDKVEIKPEYCGVEGSSMYLRAGDCRTVRELLTGLMLVSGNDAAMALADYTAGSVDEFVALMNEKAEALGMTKSSFKNPHGLDAQGHFSTARDMARLMLCCMENGLFREIAGTKSAAVNGETLVNHNRLLWKCRGCIAGKTGYTMAAGRCLISCCEREGERYVCVTLSDPDDWNDHIKLYEWAYKSFVYDKPAENLSFELPVISGNRDFVSVVPENEIVIFRKREEMPEISVHLPKFVFAPVNLGETAGELCVIIDGESAAECRLIYAESARLAQKACGDGDNND